MTASCSPNTDPPSGVMSAVQSAVAWDSQMAMLDMQLDTELGLKLYYVCKKTNTKQKVTHTSLHNAKEKIMN